MKPRHALTQWAAQETASRFERITGRSDLRLFKVAPPITVFVRGSRCRVTVQYHDLDQVELHTRLINAFGLRFLTDQDEAGVYIIAKQRRLLGWLARAEFLLKVPPYTNLALHLSPGKVQVTDINGILVLPPLEDHISTGLYDPSTIGARQTD